MEVHCCCLHLNYIVYKHLDRSLYVVSFDPTSVQNFRSVALRVFEILGFKLKNENKKNWRNDFLSYLPCQWFNSNHILGTQYNYT